MLLDVRTVAGFAGDNGVHGPRTLGESGFWMVRLRQKAEKWVGQMAGAGGAVASTDGGRRAPRGPRKAVPPSPSRTATAHSVREGPTEKD